jgi:hypothetical protein
MIEPKLIYITGPYRAPTRRAMERLETMLDAGGSVDV